MTKESDPNILIITEDPGDFDFEHPVTSHLQMINHVALKPKPNWFHRLTQKILFGSKWIKTKFK